MIMLASVVKGDVWSRSLRRIYGLPASITIITGEWKTGKTDFGLHLMEELKRLELISKMASNVFTEDQEVTYINDIMSLRTWSFMDRRRKAFLYDEAIASTPSRRAMSKLNTEWLKFIPELSKGREHLIVITQETAYTESSFLHATFIRAIWEKITLHPSHPLFRKMARLYSKLIPEIRVFKNIPRCRAKFDPYRSATFHIEPQLANIKIEDNIQIAFEYGEGLSSGDLVEKYDYLHSRKEVLRRVRVGIRSLKECYLVQASGVGHKNERKVTIDQT